MRSSVAPNALRKVSLNAYLGKAVLVSAVLGAAVLGVEVLGLAVLHPSAIHHLSRAACNTGDNTYLGEVGAGVGVPDGTDIGAKLGT